MKEKMIRFARWARSVLPSLVFALLSFAVLAEFVGLAFDIRPYIAPRAIVETYDNDAGAMVETTMETRWWNDNGFRYYGPLYFRLAHTLSTAAPFATPGQTSSLDAIEEAAHAGLLWTSLIGLFLIAASAASFFRGQRNLQLLLVFVLPPLFLRDPTWRYYLYTAHPDLTLAGFSALGFALLARSLDRGGDDFRAPTWAWGAALATKASTVFMLPALAGLVWLFDPPAWKNRIKTILKGGFIAYLLIGFPQSIDVFGVANKLAKVAVHSESFRWDSFVEWWQFFGEQIAWPTLAAILAALWAPASRTGWTWKKWGAVFALVLLTFFPITLKHLELQHRHYVIPFAAVFAVAAAWLTLRMPWRGHFHRPAWLYPRPLTVGLAAIALFMSGAGVSPQVRTDLAGALVCRPVYDRLYTEVLEHTSRGGKVLASPYTPMPVRDEVHVDIDWNWDAESIGRTEASMMFINAGFMSGYLGDEASVYLQRNNPDWMKARDLFRALDAGTYRDPEGRVWVERPDSKCAQRVWERQAKN